MNYPKSLVGAFVAATITLLVVTPATAEPPTTGVLATVGNLESDHVPGELVVGFTPLSSPAEMNAALDHSDITTEQDLAVPRTKLVKLAPGESIESAMHTLRRQPGVRFVEPNYIYRPDATPDDPSYVSLWGLNNEGQMVQGVNGTPDADIDAPEAWDLTTGSTDVVVAVIDTGIDYNHPEFAGNLWSNPGESGGGKENNHIDDDGNGFVDDWRGWDFVNSDNDPRDHDMVVGHGTHVAGTIGARGNNNGAVTGINWRVSLVSLRVFDAAGTATTATIANAFDYAGDMGIKVVNYSGGSAAPSSALQAAIDSHPSTLYVVTAGNSNLNLDAPGNDHFPCEYASSNLICVGASTPDDTRAPFSNFGSPVDLAAPGVNIMSTAPAMTLAYGESFDTDPFASRWTKGANIGINNWKAEAAYSPLGLASAPSLTDGSPLAADYPTNSDTFVQPSASIELSAQTGCSLLYTAYVDVNLGDGFRVWTRPDTVFNASNVARNWVGTGFVDDTIDLYALSGGSLNLRLGLFSDVNPESGFDGTYVDNLEVRCVGNSYWNAGNFDVRVLSGTSFAAPQVTGAAALVLSRNSSLSTAQLRNVILTTGDVKPAFQNNVTATGRRLNLFGAVSAVNPADTTPPTIAITTPANGATYTVGDIVTANYACSDGGSGIATCIGTVANGATVDTSTAGAKTFTVTAIDNAGNPAASTRNYTVVSSTPAGSPAKFTALTPARLLDTRSTRTPQAGDAIDLVVTGRDGVPSDVSAVLVNLTVTNTASDGYLTTWPKDEVRPNASSLNFAAGQTVANLVVAKVGAHGSISIWNSNDTAAMGRADILVDVVGYFPTPASIGALTPTHALDTRETAKLDAGASLVLPLLGRGGIPATGVGAVILNLTATGTQAGGYLTTWPTGDAKPNASSLNFAAGQTVANLVVAKVGADGSISIWNSNDTSAMNGVHVVADVVGWLPEGSGFGSLTPARVLDTRKSSRVGAGQTIEWPVLGVGGVPAAGVGAVVLNLTATDPRASGYLTTWSTGDARPNASSINFAAGQTVANLVVAKVGADGKISIWNSNDTSEMNSTDVIVDVVGWFAA